MAKGPAQKGKMGAFRPRVDHTHETLRYATAETSLGAALAAVSLAAAVPLLARRRHLDWLTALTMGSAASTTVEKNAQTVSPATNPGLDPIAAADQPAHWTRMLLVALPILLSGSLMANTALPLPVRGVSAIVCGLAVLLCGPYLMSHALVAWARRN